MIAEPVGNGLEEAWALTIAGRGNGLFSRGAHRHHVTPIHLLTGESGGDGLLRQCFRAGLQPQRTDMAH